MLRTDHGPCKVVRQVPCGLPKLLTCETHFVHVVLLPKRQAHSGSQPSAVCRRAGTPHTFHWVVKWLTPVDYQSQHNTKEAGEGWAAFGLSSMEVPAFRSETQQPTLFIICMAEVSYLQHQEIMPVYAQGTASDLSVFLEQ